jgi:hypothetical protein
MQSYLHMYSSEKIGLCGLKSSHGSGVWYILRVDSSPNTQHNQHKCFISSFYWEEDEKLLRWNWEISFLEVGGYLRIPCL